VCSGVINLYVCVLAGTYVYVSVSVRVCTRNMCTVRVCKCVLYVSISVSVRVYCTCLYVWHHIGVEIMRPHIICAQKYTKIGFRGG
jgi:hypothetical protein